MAKRRWRRVTPEERKEVVRLSAAGKTRREIMAAVDISKGSIDAALRAWGGVIRGDARWDPCRFRLSFDERIQIRAGIDQGLSSNQIAGQIRRSPSTVSREVRSNGGRADYLPAKAHLSATEKARRPKPTKLGTNLALFEQVVEGLEQMWSPEQIAKRLREDFPNDPEMWVSHETIYKSLYVQGRGELRRELAACLRTGRAKRKPRGRLEKRGTIPNMVLISERPAEVEDRAVPGHWEGDLLQGKGQSAIGTLVERSTRFVMLFPLRDKTAEEVRTSMTQVIKTLPEELRKSITWDRGNEMSEHLRFRVDTNVEVYFCDPYSPWQRGSNENTNGLLRQYLPKGTDMLAKSQAELNKIATSLNGRPRKTLDWRTPQEKLTELVAGTG